MRLTAINSCVQSKMYSGGESFESGPLFGYCLPFSLVYMPKCIRHSNRSASSNNMSDKRKSVPIAESQTAKRFKSFFQTKSTSPPRQAAAATAKTTTSAPNRPPKQPTPPPSPSKSNKSNQSTAQNPSPSVKRSSPPQVAAATAKTTASAPNRSPKQPKKMSFTTMDHVKSAKVNLMLQRDRFVDEYNEFIVKIVAALKKSKAIPADDTMFDCSDVDSAYYLGKLEKAGIVSVKNNTIELNVGSSNVKDENDNDSQ